MRNEVQELIKLGPMSSEKMVEVELVEKYEKLMHAIKSPLTKIEAERLASLFGPDSFYGLAWTLISLIESAPEWPKNVTLPDIENEWIQLLRERASKL
ncbi:MAG: hypothetical protein P8Z00_21800 [Anaerolineales bacterium]|jgi:hypothetical protein